MKIAIPASAPNLDAKVEHRLGTASYLMVIDPDTLTFEVVKSSSSLHGPGSGIQAISILLGMGAKALLTGYISPDIAGTLQQNGIKVVTSVKGSVREAVDAYQRKEFSPASNAHRQSGKDADPPDGPGWREALRQAARQLAGMLPLLIGIILLVGLFHGFLPRDVLLSAFSGDMLQDTLLGASIGSILAGNPVNSYVTGESLLKIGVSLFGVAAFMLTWVSVWLIQLPVEMAALGTRFALVRTLAAFVLSIPTAIIIVLISGYPK
jgi:predicted Fe-Mo cluster-binding NifX family protein